MDDLEHSVLIADQDWECFCAESEECSVQQVKLAALDDSGLSDTDDEKTSIHVSSHSAQTRPNVEEKQCLAAECEVGHTSENSEFTESSNLKNESARKTCDARLNDQEATSEYFGLDHNESNEENSPTEQSYSVINNLRGNDESQGENKSSQANTKSVSEVSSLCNQEIKHENGTECTGTVTGVTDSSPVLKKEKERWFVTVNDSQVCLRKKVGTSGQKKKRKKKMSKNLIQQSGAIREQCSFLNNNTEAEKEIFEPQTIQETLEQPPKSGSKDLLSNTHFNNAHKENYLSGSHNIQDLQSSPPTEAITNNVVHLINNTGQGSPRFTLGATTPTSPSDSEGEKTEQKELFGQFYEAQQPSSPQETPCLESSSNRFRTTDAALSPARPIFAISSFWDEMEKLTINDILQLRIAKNKSSMRESIIPEEFNSVETIHIDIGQMDSKDDSIEDINLTDDAEDSDYFTHVDDYKPDRSSCEFSTFSDYDEEFLQLLHGNTNPSPEPHEGKEQGHMFLESTCAKSLPQETASEENWPSDQNESNEIMRLYPESDLTLYMYSKTETQMHDILPTTTQDNMSSFLLDQCDIRRSTPSPVLSMSDVLDDQCLVSLFEILKNDTKSVQYQTKNPDRHISVVSFLFPQNLSVPETYDDFFSDFEVGNFFFPAVQGATKCEKNMVPIYSSSRSMVKDLSFPEVEEAKQSVSGSGRGRGFRFSLKQADMCLVCIAFASWVLKSTNPQSTDMWKAALLANVSAISAIQYLRHT